MEGAGLVYTDKLLLLIEKFGSVGHLLIQVKPAVVKTYELLFYYSVITSKEPTSRKKYYLGALSALAVILFLSLYQLRYLALMSYEVKAEMNIYLVDFLYLLGKARNGMYFGLWCTIIYSLVNRCIMLWFNLRGELQLFTDWAEESKSIYFWTKGCEIQREHLKFERYLLILFQSIKWVNGYPIILFSIFQGVLIYLTFIDRWNNGILQIIPFILWSFCLIPHTMYTSSGIVIIYGMSLSGVLHSHHKINLCFELLEKFQSIPKETISLCGDTNLLKLSRMIAQLQWSLEGHRRLSTLLFFSFAFFTTLIAAAFTYVAIVFERKYWILKYCLVIASVSVWVLIYIYPRKVAQVSMKGDELYKKLCSQRARLTQMSIRQKLLMNKLIETTGNIRRPIAYYLSSLTPFTLNFHFKFLLNIFSVIFLMMNIWNNN